MYCHNSLECSKKFDYQMLSDKVESILKKALS